MCTIHVELDLEALKLRETQALRNSKVPRSAMKWGRPLVLDIANLNGEGE